MAKLTAEEYTDEELLALYRQALAEGSTAKSITFRGKTVERPSLKDCREMIPWLEKRVAGGSLRVVQAVHGRS